MNHNKQNEAKTNRKRPTIGFSPLDDYFSHYTIISVNVKKKSDASRYPVMLLDIRQCPHFAVNAPNFPIAFPSLPPLDYRAKHAGYPAFGNKKQTRPTLVFSLP